MNSNIKKSLRRCALLIFCCLICLVSYLLYDNTRDYLPYYAPTIHEVQYTLETPSWANKQTIKEEVDKLFDNNNYTIIETKLEKGVNGELNRRKRIVFINEKISLDMYVFTLTHELAHLHHNIKNERKTNLITWELLYFSDIEYFKNIALAYADSDARGLVPYEYSILGYVEIYLKEGSK